MKNMRLALVGLASLAACTAEPRRADDGGSARVAAASPVPSASRRDEPPAAPTAASADPAVATQRPVRPDGANATEGDAATLVARGVDALRHRSGHIAVQALEEALRRATKTADDDASARSWLPFAYVATGDLDAAARRAEQLREGAPAEVEVSLRVVRADIECARGNPGKAVALYREVSKSLRDESRLHEGSRYTRLLEVELKLSLLDRELPALEPEWIVGAERFDVAGGVAVLAYLSPYVPLLSDLHLLQRLRALPGSPRVAVVVPTDADRNVPGSYELPREQWPRPSQDTRTRAAAWRTENGSDFPVLGVAPERIPVSATALRCEAVVNREGRVVYVATQSDPDGLIEESVVLGALAR